MNLAPDRNHDANELAPEDSVFWRALLYRWFVQYNPAYLLSAAFVFAGCFLWSKGAVHEGSLASTLGIPLLAEIYALSLVGGAALLTRIGQRRPAVILALIFVVYQWDTTLHTEACAYLGWVGAWASLVWLGIFVAKLFAIGRALRVRLRARVLVASILAAVGMVIAPHALASLGPNASGGLLAGWIFSLISLYDGSGISSEVPLDAWGETVLRRVTRAVWILSALLVALHVVMWSGSYPLSVVPMILGLPLLAVPRVRPEINAWLVVMGTLIVTFFVAPSALGFTAILVSGALGLRAVAPKFSPEPVYTAARDAQAAPYRRYDAIRNERENEPVSFIRPELTNGERLRCWSGALFTAYLGIWTMSMSQGEPSHHRFALDLALTSLVIFTVWRTRARGTFVVPLAATYAHLVAQQRLIPIPTTETGAGEVAIVLGFALLGGALLVSYKLRGFEVARPSTSARSSPDSV